MEKTHAHIWRGEKGESKQKASVKGNRRPIDSYKYLDEKMLSLTLCCRR